MKIPIAKTLFTQKELDNILKPLNSGWVVQGPFVKEFEEKWSEFTGCKHSIAVTSCTTALHLSLSAAGIGIGDEVIIPAFTWIATANAVESLGAKPVFCDVRTDTYNIDVEQIKSKITTKTKAIIPVHLFGLSSDMNTILKIAKDYNLLIIEDAACGFASKYYNTHVGNFGKAGCFSFHPRKAITTGEGGMITTNDDDYAAKLRSMRDHGAAMSDLQRHLGNKPYLLPEFPNLGYNYRMTDIQAAIGIPQLERANDIHTKRNYWADRYRDMLQNVSWIKPPVVDKNYVHGYQAFVSLFEPETIVKSNIDEINKLRNDFMDYLQGKDIASRPGTHSVHTLKYYEEKYNLKYDDFLNAHILDKCSITLPLYPDMTEEEFEYVTNAVINYKIKK